MVYGRYNYSIHGVYKPTNITGGHHPVELWLIGLMCVLGYPLVSSNVAIENHRLMEALVAK